MMVKLWDSTREKSPRELDNAGFIPGINVNFSSSSNTTLAVDSTVLLNVKITFRSFFLMPTLLGQGERLGPSTKGHGAGQHLEPRTGEFYR